MFATREPIKKYEASRQDTQETYKLCANLLSLVNTQKLRLRTNITQRIHFLHAKEGVELMSRTKNKLLLQVLIEDFIDSDLFTLEGLARELDTPIEVIADVYCRQNQDPSYTFGLALVELHYKHFPSLYVAPREFQNSLSGKSSSQSNHSRLTQQDQSNKKERENEEE